MEHKQAGWQTQEAALLCINNCGYFGKAETMNLCSVCYKNMVKKQEESQEKAALSIESIMNCSRSNNGEEPVVSSDLEIATSIMNSSGSNNGKEPVVLSDLDITTSIVNSSGSSSEKEHVVSSMLDIATSIMNSINGKEPVLSSDLDIATSLQLPAVKTIQSTDVSTSSEVTAVKAKEGPSRCSSCRKRVGLTGFTCRCGNLFCAMHRHSENHDCQYDYRESGRDAIAKANPVIKSAKLERI